MFSDWSGHPYSSDTLAQEGVQIILPVAYFTTTNSGGFHLCACLHTVQGTVTVSGKTSPPGHDRPGVTRRAGIVVGDHSFLSSMRATNTVVGTGKGVLCSCRHVSEFKQ